MGFRFRKSINLGVARVNISKKGVGGSIGVKGARITKTADGKTRRTVGIPGTGISYVTESSGKKPPAKANINNNNQTSSHTPSNATMWKVAFVLWMILLYFVGVLMLILCFPVGLILLGLAIFCSIMARRKKKKKQKQ